MPKNPMIVEFPTLYGLSSKGVVKVWKISVHKNSDAPVIMIEHGQLGGKIQQSPETIRSGKNIGRANETTPYDQALLEAKAKWTKQHDKNYTETMPELVEGTTEPVASSVGPGKLLPMLANKWLERKKNLIWPALSQPKLNGVRCLVQRTGKKIIFWSRKAKQYKNFPLYMEQEFLSFMKDGEILDGEMYNHGNLTFQELMSLIKDEKTPDLVKLKKYVKFHCYDRPAEGGFKSRYLDWTKTVPNGVQYLRLVKTSVVRNEVEVEKLHESYMADGYEGSIIRSGGDEPYVFQYRSNSLLKKKDFMDAEFVIVGCKEGTGKDEGKAIFRCKIASGAEFDVRCRGEDEVREEQWKNRKSYMGKELTVRYQCLSDDGIPIFPVGIAIRDYE